VNGSCVILALTHLPKIHTQHELAASQNIKRGGSRSPSPSCLPFFLSCLCSAFGIASHTNRPEQKATCTSLEVVAQQSPTAAGLVCSAKALSAKAACTSKSLTTPTEPGPKATLTSFELPSSQLTLVCSAIAEVASLPLTSARRQSSLAPLLKASQKNHRGRRLLPQPPSSLT
jgi:hypothetical protein